MISSHRLNISQMLVGYTMSYRIRMDVARSSLRRSTQPTFEQAMVDNFTPGKKRPDIIIHNVHHDNMEMFHYHGNKHIRLDQFTCMNLTDT